MITDDRLMELMLQWRGITPEWGHVLCTHCKGSGVRLYPSTSTWRGGIGGCAMTTDVCDICWGTGRADKIGVNLRER